MMKKLLIGLGVVVVLLIAAVVIIPFMVPLETYKAELAAQVEKNTGRKFKIAGDLSFSVLPRLEIEASKVSLSNARGAKTANMLELNKLQLQLALFPLLSREIVVDRFVMVDPVINLEIDNRGKPNWQFKTAKATAKPAPGKPAAKPVEDGGGVGIGSIKLGDVRLVNGRLTYNDRRKGETQVVKDINMSVKLPDIDSELEADGALTWNGEKIEMTVELETPGKVLAGKTAKLEAKVESNPVSLSYNGTLTNGKTMAAAGKVDLSVPSVRKLTAWTGQPIKAKGTGFGPLSIKGNLKLAGSRVAFEDAKLRFDEIRGDGAIRVKTGGVRPDINARLNIEKLDLNPYIPAESAKPKGAGARPTKAAKDEGWSDEPIDMSGLKAVDANLRMSVGGILAKKIKIGKTRLGVVLKAGRLTANLNEMRLYEGTGKAQIKVNGAARVPTIHQTLELSKVQALPLLKDAMDIDKVEGAANTKMTVTTRGRSQKQMVSALNGNGNVKFLNGAIRGVNLAAMARNVTTAFTESDGTQKTDFAELGGTYTIKNGIVTNNDLRMKSPFVRLEGKGTINLPNKTLRYRLSPKLVSTMKGQGGRERAKGIGVPILVKGPWANLKFEPDLKGAVEEKLKDPETTKKLLEGLTKGGKPKDVLKGLFGR